MPHAADLVSLVRSQAVDLFVFNFKRYAIAATIVAVIVWALKRTSWRSRQI